MTKLKIIAAAVSALVLLGLGTLIVWPKGTLEVPEGAKAGSMKTEPCTFPTEDGEVDADCGTLVVPETRSDPDSELIALPVVRIRATGGARREPIFRLGGGPGRTNMTFPQASRLTAGHDVVLVGYRGVDGSSRLDCGEVTGALQSSEDFVDADAQRRVRLAFSACADRLTKDGVDLAAYSVPQRVDDMESARKALGYTKINLLTSSAGTRTAMVYSWRHPESLFRSAMLSVNTPGHFVWDPKITDQQIGRLGELCAADSACAKRTDDLAGSMRSVSTDMPSRWGPFTIKAGNVFAATMYGMHQNGPSSAPQTAPNFIDAFLSAESGDPSGLWAVSTLSDLLLPSSITWGEFASFAMIDAPAAKTYYGAGGDPGSILRNDGANFVWGGPEGYFNFWPDDPETAQYRTLRPSSTETLLVSGSVDFSTPPQLAKDELLPTLTRGKQVILPELGHTGDIWEHRPEAGKHLLMTFYDTGAVDASRFDTRPMSFTPTPVSMSTIAKTLAAVVVVLALLAVGLLVGTARQVRRRGAVGRRASVLLRVLAPLPLGLGGLCVAALLVWTLSPATYLGSWTVLVPALALSIGLGAYLAWTNRDLPARTRRIGAAVAIGGAALGALLGMFALAGIAGALTALVGAAAGTNLALVLLDLRSPVPAA